MLVAVIIRTRSHRHHLCFTYQHHRNHHHPVPIPVVVLVVYYQPGMVQPLMMKLNSIIIILLIGLRHYKHRKQQLKQKQLHYCGYLLVRQEMGNILIQSNKHGNNCKRERYFLNILLLLCCCNF